MTRPPIPPLPRTTLSLRIGQWFEANATGWGVLCVPLVVLLVLLLAGALHVWGAR